MSEKSLVPISLRLNESLISVLKQEARKLSFQKNDDINYTDLVREAVAAYVSNIEPGQDYGNVLRFVEVEESGSHKFDVSNLFPNMQYSEWLSAFGFDFDNPLCTTLKGLIQNVIKVKSVSRRILEHKNGEIVKHNREAFEVIFSIARRGAVPDQIQEGCTFMPTAFDIACNPSISLDDILSRDESSFLKLAESAASTLLKEEETNVAAALASSSRESNLEFKTDYINIDSLNIGYNGLIERSNNIVKNIVMSPATYVRLSTESTSKSGDWDFPSISDGSPFAGHFRGANILLSKSFYNVVFFLNEPTLVGQFTDKHLCRVLIRPWVEKLLGSFVIWNTVSIFTRSNSVSSIYTIDEKDKDVVKMGKV